MNWQEFLTNEAISNYFVFLAGLVVGLILHFGRRLFRRRSVVEIVKQEEEDLLKIGDDARRHLDIKHQGRPVENFVRTKFHVLNKTSSPIDHIDLNLFLVEPTRSPAVYELHVQDPLGEIRSKASSVEIMGDIGSADLRLRIALPFLNDNRFEKDRLVINVYSPEPIRVDRLEGGGKGWMTKYFDKVSYNEGLRSVMTRSGSPYALIVNYIRFQMRTRQ